MHHKYYKNKSLCSDFFILESGPRSIFEQRDGGTHSV
jgi:hypothetical protein